MQPSIMVSMTSMLNRQDSSPFMRLPTEVREMIYRYLLVASYTMREHNMKSKEFNDYRGYLLHSPDQTYEFSTAILRTNRRIYEEARDLCQRENDFVCLTSERPSRLGCELEKRGLQILATGTKAQDFWNVSMTVKLDPEDMCGWPPRRSYYDETIEYRRANGWPPRRFHYYEAIDATDTSEDGRPWNYIFNSNELPTFCEILMQWRWSVLRDTKIYIDVNPVIWNGQATEMDSNRAGLSRIGKLLEPLHQLHSFGEAGIGGPLSGNYKLSIKQSVCKDCPTCLEITQTAMGLLGQGDELVSKGRLLQANLDYKAALSYARSCQWFYDEHGLIMESEPFPGLSAEQVLSNLEVRLQARIASVYLESGMQRMARIYTERALDPRRSYDRRGNKQYDVNVEPWEGVVYAEVLHVAARNSYTYGNVWEAVGHLQDATQFVPLNEEQEAMLEAWQKQGDDLYEKRARRGERKRLCLHKRDEKTEGLFLVACNWKTKGDRLLRDERSDLAVSKYGVALSNIELIRRQSRDVAFTIKTGAFEGYTARDGINALEFKVQAGVAASYLMSGRHQDVIQLAETALQCKDGYYHPLDWNHNPIGTEDQKLDYARMHYCLALSLESKGDTVLAIVELEKAKKFDPGDRKIFEQLKLLKQKQKQKQKQDERRIIRIEKLNSQQIQLQRKQANRHAKARR